MQDTAARNHLQSYIHERLPNLIPGFFEGAFDQPSIGVDQRSLPLKEPPYPH